MKRTKCLTISLGVLILVIVGIINFYNDSEKVILKDSIINNNSKAISYMYEDENGDYIESTNTSWDYSRYSFNSEKSKCENGSRLEWNSTTNSVKFTGNISDKCYVFFDIIKGPVFSTYIKSLYSSDGVGGLYYHDGQDTYGTLEAGLGSSYEMSYRYSGANPNNYVCFGGECDTSGTSENLYRIIGVFDDEVKLIKAKKALSSLLGTSGAYISDNTYVWDRTSDYNNVWSHSLLNLNNLNSGYTPGGSVNLNYGFLYTIGSKWANMIADHTWKVGGNTSSNIQTTTGIRNIYKNEVGSTNGEVNYTNKVGLMYVTDYMYASDPTDTNRPWSNLMGSNASTSLNFYGVKAKNWMNSSVVDMTITPEVGGDSVYTFVDCNVDRTSVNSGVTGGVRPTFYLKSTVHKTGGTGSSIDPYIIVE